MTEPQTSFARLIEALEKDYEMRNEGDVYYNVEITRGRNCVSIALWENEDRNAPNHYLISPVLSSSDSIPAAIALCCDRLREKVGK